MIPNCKKKLDRNILDSIYPVGVYVETEDVNFNPNNSFGGEWELRDKDFVISTNDDSNTSYPSVYKWVRTN